MKKDKRSILDIERDLRDVIQDDYDNKLFWLSQKLSGEELRKGASKLEEQRKEELANVTREAYRIKGIPYDEW